MTTSTAVTAEQFLLLPDDLCRRDLMEGEVRTMAAAGTQHGIIAMRIGQVVGNYVDDRGLGLVFAAETGFTLARNPDTVLAPDAAFLRAGRDPGWCFARRVLGGGTRSGGGGGLPWRHSARGRRQGGPVPALRRAAGLGGASEAAHRGGHAPGAAPRTLDAEATLDGGEVLPGFSYPLAQLWAGI